LAKYKALKKFFDKLRHRGNPQPAGGSWDEEYYDMGGEVTEKVRVSAEGNGQAYPLLEKPDNSVSNV
jgi:hypothetical protein